MMRFYPPFSDSNLLRFNRRLAARKRCRQGKRAFGFSFDWHRLAPTDTSAESADRQKTEELWRSSEQLISLA